MVERGIKLDYRTMFSGEVGKLILFRLDRLASNLYAVAGQESNHYTGANGDSGWSYGLFQFHTKVHKLNHIEDYISIGTHALGINEIFQYSKKMQSKLNVDSWAKSVGFTTKEYPPIITEKNVNVDVQLVAWLGYMKVEDYFDRLCTIEVYKDITKYQKAQRFHLDYLEEYKKGTEGYYKELEKSNVRIDTIMKMFETLNCINF